MLKPNASRAAGLECYGFFSGIGGFELGFERAGFEVKSVCEIDPFCNQVLKKHWPQVPNLGDIQSLSAASRAKTSALPASRRALTENEAASIATTSKLLRLVAQTGSSPKTSHTSGASGCPNCGAASLESDIPVCRFECEPLTWERRTKGRESISLPTPTARSYGSCRGGGSGRVGKWRMSLHSMARRNQWPTPTASPNANRNRKACPSHGKTHGRVLAGEVNEIEKSAGRGGGPLNPTWVEWLMGFPMGWTLLPQLETQSSRRSRKSSPAASRSA